MIGGANGSGKTTVSLSLLPNFLQVFEYVNADAIAAGLSPLNPESMAIQAGRLMLERLQTLVNSGADFAFETTLAARTFVPFLQECARIGYTINLIYAIVAKPRPGSRTGSKTSEEWRTFHLGRHNPQALLAVGVKT